MMMMPVHGHTIDFGLKPIYSGSNGISAIFAIEVVGRATSLYKTASSKIGLSVTKIPIVEGSFDLGL